MYDPARAVRAASELGLVSSAASASARAASCPSLVRCCRASSARASTWRGFTSRTRSSVSRAPPVPSKIWALAMPRSASGCRGFCSRTRANSACAAGLSFFSRKSLPAHTLGSSQPGSRPGRLVEGAKRILEEVGIAAAEEADRPPHRDEIQRREPPVGAVVDVDEPVEAPRRLVDPAAVEGEVRQVRLGGEAPRVARPHRLRERGLGLVPAAEPDQGHARRVRHRAGLGRAAADLDRLLVRPGRQERLHQAHARLHRGRLVAQDGPEARDRVLVLARSQRGGRRARLLGAQGRERHDPQEDAGADGPEAHASPPSRARISRFLSASSTSSGSRAPRYASSSIVPRTARSWSMRPWISVRSS